MKLGLCLSGGGVKGAAHIGVLKALSEEKIKIDYISGTSSGSIVATLHAIGYTPEEIYNLFNEYCKEIKFIEIKNILKLLSGLIIKRKIIIEGLSEGKNIEKIINKACNEKNITNINQIKTPLLIPSVDLNNGKIYMFSSNKNRTTYLNEIEYIYDINIGKAVHASCSYPGIFSPCKYKNKKLIDGGIRENVPWKETKINGADKVISVIFKENVENKKNENIINVITNSIDILSYELSNYELAGADYLLKIKTEDIELLDYSKIEYLYKLGYETTKKEINKIKKLIK